MLETTDTSSVLRGLTSSISRGSQDHPLSAKFRDPVPQINNLVAPRTPTIGDACFEVANLEPHLQELQHLLLHQIQRHWRISVGSNWEQRGPLGLSSQMRRRE